MNDSFIRAIRFWTNHRQHSEAKTPILSQEHKAGTDCRQQSEGDITNSWCNSEHVCFHHCVRKVQAIYIILVQNREHAYGKQTHPLENLELPFRREVVRIREAVCASWKIEQADWSVQKNLQVRNQHHTKHIKTNTPAIWDALDIGQHWYLYKIYNNGSPVPSALHLQHIESTTRHIGLEYVVTLVASCALHVL